MKETLTQKDWLTISAYLDGRLEAGQHSAVEARMQADSDFKQALLEIDHTKKLLASLPVKRAPRNFTLSTKYEKSRSRKWGLHSYFGLTSATAALAMVVMLAVGLFSPKLMAAAPAPKAAAQFDAMSESVALATQPAENTPMIITWGQAQDNQAIGMGGGGNSSSASVRDFSGGEMLGAAPAAAQPAGALPMESSSAATESPQTFSAESSATQDLSNIILGIPDVESQGKEINITTSETTKSSHALNINLVWLIGLGSAALIFGVLFFVFRRK